MLTNVYKPRAYNRDFTVFGIHKKVVKGFRIGDGMGGVGSVGDNDAGTYENDLGKVAMSGV